MTPGERQNLLNESEARWRARRKAINDEARDKNQASDEVWFAEQREIEARYEKEAKQP